ncbi:conserved hypothetical protein [Ricinus communis]|uniref:Uncharacterized protein n=1 Tax=Ricinus communis TaxID=3988 RepID=B9S1R0_RICCO|nr:conserved hypothetical protein [Ricinus communis]
MSMQFAQIVLISAEREKVILLLAEQTQILHRFLGRGSSDLIWTLLLRDWKENPSLSGCD